MGVCNAGVVKKGCHREEARLVETFWWLPCQGEAFAEVGDVFDAGGLRAPENVKGDYAFRVESKGSLFQHSMKE